MSNENDSKLLGSVVSDPQHSKKILRALRSFQLEQCFHDAILVIDDEEIPVQKNILAAASPYIRYAPEVLAYAMEVWLACFFCHRFSGSRD